MKDLAVLIPSYNDNEALQKTLQSISEPDNSFTVVVVDDGSPEPVVIDTEDYPFSIHLIRLQKNRGITGALNSGLHYVEESGFKYVARLDAADLNRPNRLSTQYQRMEKDPTLGMLGSNVVFLDETTHEPLFTTNLPLTSRELQRRIVFHNCFIHPSVIMRVEVLKTTGFYDPDYRHIEDLVLFTRITEAAPTANIDEPLVDCYIRAWGISGKNFRAQMLSGIRFKLLHPKPLQILWWAALVKRTGNMILPQFLRSSIKKIAGVTRKTHIEEVEEKTTSNKSTTRSAHHKFRAPGKVEKKIREAGGWLSSRLQNRGGILLYHRVHQPIRDPFRLCVSPEHFLEHLEILAESGRALPLNEFMERKSSGDLDPGAISITFDDGYLDVFTNALPMLERFEIPATVFVTTGNLGRPFWWDHLADLIFYTTDPPESLPYLPDFGEEKLVLAAPRKELFRQLHDYFRSIPDTERKFLIETIEKAGWIGSGDVPRAASENEIKAASTNPLLTIGAHTVNHCRLSSLPYEEQKREIEGSLKTLQRITGRSITTLSYPFGLQGRDWSEDTCRATEESGLSYGFTADRNVVTSSTPPYEIPRIWIHNREGEAFRRQLRFWLGSSFSSIPVPVT